MTTYSTVIEFETAILADISTVSDAAQRNIIQDLLIYAKNKEEEAEEKEKEAENRELRPRPESVAEFRALINMALLPNDTFRTLISDLLDLVESYEQQLQD